MGITLGLDIGTQYCYAGYYDENARFQVAFPCDGTGAEYGIPTDVAYNRSTKRFKFGFDARQQRSSGGSEWGFLSGDTSLKTLMRGAFRTSSLVFGRHGLEEVMEQFLQYIAGEIRNHIGRDRIFERINIAFPDVTAEGTHYFAQKLRELVAKAFCIDQGKVFVRSESEYAADLLKRIFNKQGTLPPSFCTIDVGAGTTDISLVRLKERKYVSEFFGAFDFGGKYIDQELINMGAVPRNASDIQMLGHKKWMFEEAGGLSISGLGDRSPEFYRNTVSQYLSKNGNVRDLLSNLIPESGESVNESLHGFFDGCWKSKIESCTIIAMGGSSTIPWVSEKIGSGMQFYGERYGITMTMERLEEIGSDFGATNSNFLAMAAASYGKDICYGQRQAINPRTDNWSSFTYAVKAYDGDDEVYVILARRGRSERKETERNECATRQTANGEPIDFDPGRNLFRLELKKDLPERMSEIKGEDIEEYIKRALPLKEGDFVNLTGTIPNSAGKAYKRILKFVYGASVGSQLQVNAIEESKGEGQSLWTLIKNKLKSKTR